MHPEDNKGDKQFDKTVVTLIYNDYLTNTCIH